MGCGNNKAVSPSPQKRDSIQNSTTTEKKIANQNLISSTSINRKLSIQKTEDNLLLNQIQNLSKIQLKQVIGKGANAPVYFYQLNGQNLAAKVYANEAEALQERKILEKIKQIKNCPGIIPYYGTKKLLIEIENQEAFEGYVIFMEACETNLEKFVLNEQLTPDQVFDFVNQLSLTLAFLHAHDCFHRDMKPSNILLKKEENKIKYYLCDFGESQIIQSEMQTYYDTLSLRGTPFYLPPELFTM